MLVIAIAQLIFHSIASYLDIDKDGKLVRLGFASDRFIPAEMGTNVSYLRPRTFNGKQERVL